VSTNSSVPEDAEHGAVAVGEAIEVDLAFGT